MPTPARHRTIWVGTYPAAGQGTTTGQGEGIWQVRLDTHTGHLDQARQIISTPAPSYLAFGGPANLLYAVNEDDSGQLSAFRVTADECELVATASTGGAHPCHLLLVDALQAILVANYTSGSVALLRLSPNGAPERRGPDLLIQFEGSGPVADRQQGPHEHFLLPTPDGGHILVVDLGSDCIRRLAIDSTARSVVSTGIAVQLPRGSGPRHATFSANGLKLYVVGELDGLFHTIEWDPAAVTGRVMTSSPISAETKDSYPAHIERVGDTLYVGLRGLDHIALVSLDRIGVPGRTRAVTLPGSWPRHHTVVDGWIVVAQQRQGGVLALQDDCIGTPIDIPSAAFVRLAPPELQSP